MGDSQLIHPKYYYGESVKKLEFDKIFSKNWIFAGMTSDFSENNAFVTLNIFGYPVIIQNFNGELKAFENICPHRFNKIQTKAKGTRFFMCSYHNWAFDKNGNVKTLPKKTSFEIRLHFT
jgi:phenylpropionate dioxygenase-like ring-hydroxylating dioxygenase large terminal subunit